VDALEAGFGIPDAQDGWHVAVRDVYYDVETGEIQDSWRSALGNPVPMELDPIPPDQVPFAFSPALSTGLLEPGQPPTWGTFPAFPGVPWEDTLWWHDGPGSLGFSLSKAQSAKVASARLYVDEADTGAFEVYTPPDLPPQACVPQADESLYPVFYKIDLPNGQQKEWSDGLHQLRTRLQLTNGATVDRIAQIRFANVPAWFLASPGHRWATWTQDGYELHEPLVG